MESFQKNLEDKYQVLKKMESFGLQVFLLYLICLTHTFLQLI